MPVRAFDRALRPGRDLPGASEGFAGLSAEVRPAMSLPSSLSWKVFRAKLMPERSNIHEVSGLKELSMAGQLRFFALELKKEPMDREQLVSLLERLRAGGLPWQSIGVWYLPQEPHVDASKRRSCAIRITGYHGISVRFASHNDQDLPLFEQLHRDQHPETLGIMVP